jgi:hypothetical protein
MGWVVLTRQAYPESAIAINLKACNHFRLYNGKAAEAELKAVEQVAGGDWMENDLIRHNLVVFRSGENALQVRFSLRGCIERDGERGGRGCVHC